MKAKTRNRIALVSCLLVALPALVFAIGTIKKLKLKEGINGENKIKEPIFDTLKLAPLYIGPIERAYSLDQLIVRKGSEGDLWMGSGTEYYLDEKVDLADLLRETLQTQGEAMGFKIVTQPENAWQISGTLNDIYMDNEQVWATLFYGYVDVELEVRSPDGETTSHELSLYNYKAVQKRGFSRQPRAREALAVTLVEGAHEILAYLNMSLFNAPIRPETAQLFGDLEDANLNEIYRVGLTGSNEAVPALMRELARNDDEDERMFIIVALARLRSPEVIPMLSERYEEEDEDGRWATMKAMGYLGDAEALALARDKGLVDEYLGAQALATKVLGET